MYVEKASRIFLQVTRETIFVVIGTLQCRIYLRIEMQIFSLHWMMQNIRLFNVCEARRASWRH